MKGDIVRLVFAQGSRWVAFGLALGIGGAFWGLVAGIGLMLVLRKWRLA